jgi:hypothetical protein
MTYRLLLSTLATLMFAVLASATPLTFNTPYIVTDPYAGTTGQNPTSGDVVGDFTKFDINVIKFLQLDSTLIRAEIDLNYDEGATGLPMFSVGSHNLNIGDLLFGDSSGHYSFGVGVQTHSYAPNGGTYGVNSGGLTVLAGALYQINTGGILLAENALNDYSAAGTSSFRGKEAVWMWNNGTSLTQLTNGGSVSVASIGGKEIAVTVSFVPNAAFISAIQSGNLYVHFASATCGNDVINGQLQPVPEAGTWSMLFGGALIGAGLWRRRSKKV